MLRKGSRGSEVVALQEFLIAQGYDLGSFGADGIFGSLTDAAVRAFQESQGLTVDGIVGPNTSAAIEGIGTTVVGEEEDVVEDVVEDEPTGGTDNEPTDSDPADDPVGAVNDGEDGGATVPGIMGGGTFTRITRAGQDDLYAMVYNVNGIEHVYTFDSFEAAERILGEDPISQGQYGFQVMDESSVDDGDTWTLGDAAAFAGQSGTYQTYFDDIMQEAALEAGVRNPGKLGEYLSDPDVQRIIAEGEAGGWSPERVQAEIRNTNYYQNVLYPGISAFLAQGSPNPEGEWRRYMGDVESSLEMLGYVRDADGTYGQTVGQMLEAGITAENFANFAPMFVRAEQSQDFAAVLNQWTENDLGKSLEFTDWFDVLAGETSTELASVVEKATLQYQAERTNTILSDATITRLANATNLSEAQMAQAFSQSEQALLAIGSQNLERFGLSEEALVNSAFSLEGTVADPLSSDGVPLTANEVQRRARKAATQLGLADDRKAQFFVGFTPEGKPRRGGLAALQAETG